MLTENQKNVLVQVSRAVIETVVEAGDMGVPSGHMYLAFQAALGMPLDAYQNLMDVLVKGGFLEQRGHVYYATDEGKRLYAMAHGGAATKAVAI